MTFIQNFFMAILPRRWAEAMRSESQEWAIRCTECGTSRSVWDAGGIRWKATSAEKATVVDCSKCGGLKPAAFVRIRDAKA